MSDREISCCKCGKHVGTIRDAKLMKGLKFICPTCDVRSSSREDDISRYASSGFADIFGDIFNGKSK